MSSQFANKGRPLVETASADEIAEETASKVAEPNPEQVIAEIEKERDELKAANEDLKSRVVSDTERKHFAKLEDEYIAASKERDELKARLYAVKKSLVKHQDCHKCKSYPHCDGSDCVCAVVEITNILRAARGEGGAK